jgi:lysophospholipase L1-like esterase
MRVVSRTMIRRLTSIAVAALAALSVPVVTSAATPSASHARGAAVTSVRSSLTVATSRKSWGIESARSSTVASRVSPLAWSRSLDGGGHSPLDVPAAIAQLGESTGYGNSVNYVALGDSYSSGEGNPVGSPGWLNGHCHRSAHAWPEILAGGSLHLNLTAFVACSGATTAAIGGFYSDPYNSTGLENETAGTSYETPQLDAIVSNRPQLVTVTIGGNDLGFRSVLQSCYLRGVERETKITLIPDCVGSGRVLDAMNSLPSVQQTLAATYESINEALASSYGQLVVVGYPNLLPSSYSKMTGCGWIDQSVYAGLSSLQSMFDWRIQQAVAEANRVTSGRTIIYVPIDSALAGHELCTSNTWVHPITPAAANPLGVAGSGDGHPTYSGQQAMAQMVAQALAKFGY